MQNAHTHTYMNKYYKMLQKVDRYKLGYERDASLVWYNDIIRLMCKGNICVWHSTNQSSVVAE